VPAREDVAASAACSWASGSCAAEWEAREDARMLRGCSPATGSAGWPAMARRRVSLAAGFPSGGACGDEGKEGMWEHEKGNSKPLGRVL
jgi:hypothetical protein